MNLLEIAKHFQIQGTPHAVIPHGNGHIHDTYRIHTAPETPDYILQRVNSSVFRQVAQVMSNIQVVTEHIRQRLLQSEATDLERRSLQLVLTHDHKSYYQDHAGKYWRMYVYVPRSKALEMVNTTAQAYEIGRAFGQFECWVSDLAASKLVDTIPDFHHVGRRLLRLEYVYRENVAQRAREVQEAVAYIRDLAEPMGRVLRLGLEGKLPRRVTHNDTKFNNVLLDEATEKSLCVVDLDTVMSGYLQYDFSDGIRTVANVAAEDEQDISKIYVDLDRFEAYARGFLSELEEITSGEVQELVPSAALMPYVLSVRFLTDYLEGDVYFKTAFPAHNRQRGLAQLQLVRSIQAEQHRLQERINRMLDKVQ